MTEIYLITGFLGSGKTTFLNSQLEDSHKQVGVLMNEFGKVSMDTLAIKTEEVDLLELKNGSIFCACLKEDFIDGLAELVKRSLDIIYIESSGLADPSDMGKVMEVLSKKVSANTFEFRGTICLIDGLFFERMFDKLISVGKQIVHSHHILINKVDLISKEQVERIINKIRSINPKVSITPISFGCVEIEKLNIRNFYIEDEDSSNTEDSKPKTVLLTFKANPSRHQLDRFLEKMGAYFYRIKGYIQLGKVWYKVDLVNDQIEVQPHLVKKNTEDQAGYGQLVCLTSQGIKSIGHLIKVAEKELTLLYDIEM